MKYAIFILVLFLSGCSWLQEKLDDHTRTCVVLCSAMSDMQCFKTDMAKMVDFASGTAECINKCVSTDKIRSSVDIDCIIQLDNCELGKCFSLE